ncbi:MAG: peptidoglycan editing factor PgeF [Alphaproteobacteria bacterium]|nr:peptidoglycan editing factor PgeF [Alphaproteobacteria bacterium]
MKQMPYFKSSTLKNVRHGFFGRQGGVSDGLVSSLNCYPYIREKTQQIDEIKNVQQNRKIILNTLGINAADVVTANQVHGDVIVTIHQQMPMDFSDADGIITDAPGLPIGILTADCVPVLYTDINAKVVGVVHAGWKSAFLDIHLKMIDKLKAIGIPSCNIIACVGPSIQQGSYEVDQDFFDRFLSKDGRYRGYFYPSIPHHYQFDLPRIVYDDLMASNLHSVDWVRLDTAIHETFFFSHRRATLSGTLVTGRQLSVVSL